MKRTRCALIITTFVILATVATGMHAAIAGDTDEQSVLVPLDLSNLDASLETLEQKVFKHQYADKPAELRLEELEKEVFGQIETGSLMQRLSNLHKQITDREKSTQTAARPQPRRMIKGIVHQADLEKFGIELAEETKSENAFEPVIKSVANLSAAEKWGICPGDIVLGVRSNPTSTLITISRNKKIYSAQLSAERVNLSSALKQSNNNNNNNNDSTKETSVERFAGRLVDGYSNNKTELTSEVTTEFNITPAGIQTGSYHLNGYDGTLQEGRVLSLHDVCFRWFDKHGDGTLIVTFSDDFKSFAGHWTIFHSKKGLSSDSDPFLDPLPLKNYGMKWYGSRLE